MKLRIGLSPCPNDTFMLDALINQKVDWRGLEWEVVMEDVEQLNRRALRGELDVTKLSFHAGLLLRDQYALLGSGAALGHGCGPLVIARHHLSQEAVEKGTVAIPGNFTTANLLFKLRYPHARPGLEMLFSEIEEAIITGKVDAGVIIHENRFTYQDKGLIRIIDLGQYWEDRTGLPIPLGGFFAQRRLSEEIRKIIGECIQASISHAFKNPQSSTQFVRQHAQEMDQTVIKQHIDLYVNQFSLDLGEIGRQAIVRLAHEATESEILNTTALS